MSTPVELVRRVADVVAGCAVLVLTTPLMLAVTVAVRVRLGSPVLYRQQRVGLGGRPFAMVKFRTLSDPLPGREAPEFDHERLSPFGRRLRATSLDELPSMVNLIRGQLTLVGPRPLPVHYLAHLSDAERERFAVKPGVTGLAQINGRNALDWTERLAIDVRYVRTRSLRGDLMILLGTVPVVFSRKGVSSEQAATMVELPAVRP